MSSYVHVRPGQVRQEQAEIDTRRQGRDTKHGQGWTRSGQYGRLRTSMADCRIRKRTDKRVRVRRSMTKRGREWSRTVEHGQPCTTVLYKGLHCLALARIGLK